MNCSYPQCWKKVEGDYEEMLKQGFGFCPMGHRSDLPGSTQGDRNCECGAVKSNQPGHAWYCPEFRKIGL